jgi:hypothetical protein
LTNSTSSDHYSILIAGTNNTQLASADQVSRAVDIRGYEKISIGQGIPTSYQGGPGLGRAGAFISGSVEANAGDRFRYTITGNDTTVFVFTLMDFQNMERTGKCACNAPLSKPADISGEIDQPVGSGTYWYLVAIRGVEGWFSSFWH